MVVGVPWVWAEEKTDESVEPMVITQDTVLAKDAVLDRPIVIQASGITLDGNGATLEGPGKAEDPESFQGTGITAEGCSNVTLRGIKVRGFRVGLSVENGEQWSIEDCDFSDNYTNPEIRWNRGFRFGGIVLTNVRGSTIRRNTAQRVWDGLDMARCDDNTITENNFSHCTNICLRMWNCCRNVVEDNVLSYGFRLRPGDGHAYDSACVMLESGSDDNRFVRNDVTHGGDGIFVRALDSMGNVFIENDCSWANNNCIEC